MIWREAGWPFGAVQSGAVEAIPEGALARLYDAYWPDDGMPERRGGSVYKSSSALSPAPRWIADRRLAGGQRTAFANSSLLSSLAADDTSLSTVYSAVAPDVAVAPVSLRGMLFWSTVAGPSYAPIAWGGSRKADYSTGTVSVTNGSQQVTGVGTTWTTNVDRGMLLLLSGGVKAGVVDSVNSNTSISLIEPWAEADASGSVYTLTKAAQTGGTGNPSTPIVALGSVAGRLLVARGSQLGFSSVANMMRDFDETDLHVFPAPILGIGNLRDTAIIFTTEGTYAIYNMALDLTDAAGDPQQRIERINDELILWGQHGIANWRNALITPMLDGVWLIDGVGQPQKISASFEDQYQSHVRAGYVPGTAAVFNGHCFLPIVDTSGNAQDLLTCRLTPNSAGRAMLWSQHRGHGGGSNVIGVAARAPTAAGVAPVLLAAGDDGKISTLRHFEPASAYKSDADAVAHVFEIQTRAFETGRNRRNHVDQVTVHYTLVDAASDNPTVELSYALDGGTSWTVVSGTGSESSGTVQKRTWRVGKAARTIQFRLRTANAAATAKFRSIEVKTRDSARP